MHLQNMTYVFGFRACRCDRLGLRIVTASAMLYLDSPGSTQVIILALINFLQQNRTSGRLEAGVFIKNHGNIFQAAEKVVLDDFAGTGEWYIAQVALMLYEVRAARC